MTIELVPLATMTGYLRPPISIGNRTVFELEDGHMEGERIRAKLAFNTPGAAVYSTPRFETADERYLWLNAVQAVGKGVFDGTALTYELYELR